MAWQCRGLRGKLASRGGKGIRTIQRSGFKLVRRPPIELVDWQALEQPTG